MVKSLDELIQLRQEGKITELQFVMDSEYAKTYLNWCAEKRVDPSDSSASDFWEEFEYDMFEQQSNIETDGFFSL